MAPLLTQPLPQPLTVIEVKYRDGETPLTGFLARPDAPGVRPGLLVCHGGAGLDAHARERASRLAGLGFVALACDLFGDGVAGERQRVMATILALRDDPSTLCRRAQAGLDALSAQPDVGPLGAVGFCFGGLTVLELARSGAALAGVVSFHGSLSTRRPAAPGAVRSKLLVCHGALDPHVPAAQVSAFLEEMNACGADYQLIAYGGAVHGFTHEGPPQGMPGVAHHALADARSWAAMRAFLGECFSDALPAAVP